MKTLLCLVVPLVAVACIVVSCTSKKGESGSYARDSVTIEAGRALFTQHCSACHNFNQDGIGPRLGGVTKEVPADWLRKFIASPEGILKSDDERGKILAANYKIPMPSFAQLKDGEVTQILAFIDTHPKPTGTTGGPEPLKDPIPGSVDSSSLVIDLELVAQFPASADKPPLARITQLDVQPEGSDLFVLDLRGKLYRLHNNKPAVYMDMAALETKFINQPGLASGFGSFAFHPDFKHNGLLYTTHSEPPRSKNPGEIDFDYADSIKSTLQWVVQEWKTSQPGAPAFSGTSRELFRISMVAGIHGVQQIGFNPTAKKNDRDFGLLYIGIGDGGAVENGYQFLAHSTSQPWGTILRIDPAGHNSKNGKYGIPQLNPFVQNPGPGSLGEIYAYGFRNPHRFTWTTDGKMIAVNVGHSNIESLNLIEPGHDYGWPIREGTFLLNPSGDLSKVYPLPPDDQNFHITYPVAQYDHAEGGKAISGGFQYTGAGIPELKGKYLFGDIPRGFLFYVDVLDLHQGGQATIRGWRVAWQGKPIALNKLCGSDRVDLHFGRDGNGNMYILTKADGKLYRLAKSIPAI